MPLWFPGSDPYPSKESYLDKTGLISPGYQLERKDTSVLQHALAHLLVYHSVEVNTDCSGEF